MIPGSALASAGVTVQRRVTATALCRIAAVFATWRAVEPIPPPRAPWGVVTIADRREGGGPRYLPRPSMIQLSRSRVRSALHHLKRPGVLPLMCGGVGGLHLDRVPTVGELAASVA